MKSQVESGPYLTPAQSHAAPTGGDVWDSILEPGEEIIWQGRPDGNWAFHHTMLFPALQGSAILFFGSIMALVSLFSFAVPQFLVGLMIIAFGCFVLGKGVFWRSYVLRHSWYTLSNRKAYIATDMPYFGRDLKDYPITSRTPLEYHDGTLPSVYFENRTVRRGKRLVVIRTGFERIADGPKVYAKMQEIQRNAPL